jgi:hypothetical protein
VDVREQREGAVRCDVAATEWWVVGGCGRQERQTREIPLCLMIKASGACASGGVAGEADSIRADPEGGARSGDGRKRIPEWMLGGFSVVGVDAAGGVSG